MSQVGREPKVVDANGRELLVGSRVQTPSCGPDDAIGTVTRVEWAAGIGWRIVTCWPDETLAVTWPLAANTVVNTYRCPDLVLHENNEKETASDR